MPIPNPDPGQTPERASTRGDMEVRLRFLGVRLLVRGPARWVFALTVVVVLAVAVLTILGH